MKYRGATSSHGRTTSAAWTATSLIRRSSTLVLVKCIRLLGGDFRVAILRIPSLQGFLRCPREECFEKTGSLGPLDGKMERQKGIMFIDFMA